MYDAQGHKISGIISRKCFLCRPFLLNAAGALYLKCYLSRPCDVTLRNVCLLNMYRPVVVVVVVAAAAHLCSSYMYV